MMLLYKGSWVSYFDFLEPFVRSLTHKHALYNCLHVSLLNRFKVWYRQTNKQTTRQTDRQTDKYIHTLGCFFIQDLGCLISIF